MKQFSHIFYLKLFLVAIVVAASLVFRLFGEIGANAQQSAVARIPAIAKDVCSNVSEKGQVTEFEGKISGSLKAMILQRFLGAGGEISGKLKSKQWDGIQSVAKEHQLAENFSLRECIKDMVPQLIKLEITLRKMQERSEIRQKSPLRVVNRSAGNQMECLDVRYVNQYPVAIKTGMCVTDETASHISIFKRVSVDVVVYSNATGKIINCYRGDSCSFGWPGSPVFGVSSDGNQVFLVKG